MVTIPNTVVAALHMRPEAINRIFGIGRAPHAISLLAAAPALPEAERLAEAHPGPSAVFLEELDARRLQGVAKLGAGFVRYPGPEAGLDPFHRRKRELGSRREVSLRPAQ
jgi:hypothetical protein